MKLVIFKLGQNFLHTGSIQDAICSGKSHMTTTKEIHKVRKIAEQHAQTSMWHLATCAPINSSSARRRLEKVIGMKPYNMSCLQELKAADCLCHLHYVNWMLNFIREHSVQPLDHMLFLR